MLRTEFDWDRDIEACYVSDDRSIRDLIGGWQGFLVGGPIVTQEFTITRQP